jgi:hypothetical protein
VVDLVDSDRIADLLEKLAVDVRDGRLLDGIMRRSRETMHAPQEPGDHRVRHIDSGVEHYNFCLTFDYSPDGEPPDGTPCNCSDN